MERAEAGHVAAMGILGRQAAQAGDVATARHWLGMAADAGDEQAPQLLAWLDAPSG